MNVIFLEPGFPANQREFVRALASVGAFVVGVGDRPYDWLDDELKGWLGGYQQIESVTDEGALEWAVRQVQGRMWIDRLEAVVEAHVLPAAHVRERCSHPRHLRPHRLSLPRQGRDEGGAAPGRRADRRLRRASPASPRPRDFVEAVGFPVILKPRDAAGASGTFRAGNAGRVRRRRPRQRPRRRRPGRDRGVRRGARGLLRHPDGQRPRRPRLRQPLLPERARGDAHPLDLAADRRDQPHARAGLRRGQGDGPAGEPGARHRHRRHAHGVVLRPEGPEVLRDRLPAARRRPVGQLLRRQRVRPLPRMGARGLLRHHRPPALAPLRLRHHRAPPRPRRPDRRLRRHRGHLPPLRPTSSSAATSPPPAPRPSPSPPATWPTPGCASATPTTTTCAAS